MVLSDEQRDLLRWYFVESRTVAEISELRHCAYRTVLRDIHTLRAIFASHGQELPKYNHGRPHKMPNLPETAVA